MSRDERLRRRVWLRGEIMPENNLVIVELPIFDMFHLQDRFGGGVSGAKYICDNPQLIKWLGKRPKITWWDRFLLWLMEAL